MKQKDRSNGVFWSSHMNKPSKTEYRSLNFALEMQVILSIREANPSTFCQLIRQHCNSGHEHLTCVKVKKARQVVHAWNLESLSWSTSLNRNIHYTRKLAQRLTTTHWKFMWNDSVALFFFKHVAHKFIWTFPIKWNHNVIHNAVFHEL